MIFSYITTGTPSPAHIREAFVSGRIYDFVRIHRDAFEMMARQGG
jgi:hypothetical protein